MTPKHPLSACVFVPKLSPFRKSLQYDLAKWLMTVPAWVAVRVVDWFLATGSVLSRCRVASDGHA